MHVHETIVREALVPLAGLGDNERSGGVCALLSCARGCTLELVYCKALVYAAAASNGDLGGEQRNDMSWIASRDIAAPGVASVCCGCC